ncbi:hypothetical protein [Anaerosporobacter sp.]|uniref:hypothetical protein n=1 Tax=Anaerosporobacter sp. TaxID=1872529 RepID=UPI00286F255D|nr:hypothetical protein [Anaerosporobacter sp.]
MKKNFVKKTLASTLALAMVATAMPAAFTTASAAAAPALNKTAKTIYINEENPIGSTYTFTVKNKVAKSTYAWSSSNKAKATVTSKGVVKAAKTTGNVTISCKITLPTKKTKTLKATVTVKENATEIKVKNAPEAAIGIGADVYDFDSTFSTASGAKATDYRTWEIKEGETNTAGATINSKNGKVTTTKAGKFEVRVRAFQNNARLAANDTLDTDWLTVNVVASIKEVKQSATSKINVTFDDNMKDTVKAADFIVTNKTNNVVSAVKELSFSEDGKVVTVVLYGALNDATTYTLAYAGTEIEFGATIGEVDSIVVDTTTVEPGIATPIAYRLLNANGVDITDVKKSDVTIKEIENKDGWLDGSSITIFNKDSKATVELTYHTYKYDSTGNEEGAKTVTAVIVCAEKPVATVGNYDKYVITSDAKVADWSKATTNNVICVGEDKNLFVYGVDSAKVQITGLTFESGNDEVLMVDTQGEGARLVAIKEGSTTVLVKKDGKLLWNLPVVIKAARKANAISLVSNTITVSNSATLANKTVEIKVKDQHGDDYAVNADVVDVNPAKTTYVGAPVVSVDGNKLDINATAAKAGDYQYIVNLKADSTKKTVLTVTVKDVPTTGKSSYSIQLSSNTVDAVVNADTTVAGKAVTVNVIESIAGIQAKYPTAKVTITGQGYDKTFDVDATATSASFQFITVDEETGIATTATTGAYKVTVSVKNEDGKDTVVGTTSFKVDNSQVAPTAKVEKTSTEATTIEDAIKDCVVIKDAAGNVISAINSVDVVELKGGNQVYVNSVKVYVTFTNADGKEIKVEQKVLVNRTLTYKPAK